MPNSTFHSALKRVFSSKLKPLLKDKQLNGCDHISLSPHWYSSDQSCLFMRLCCTFAGGEIKGDKPHISAAGATTGKAEKWVIYMPTEQSDSNLHASSSAFQPRQQTKKREKVRGKAVGAGREERRGRKNTGQDEDYRGSKIRDKKKREEGRGGRC